MAEFKLNAALSSVVESVRGCCGRLSVADAGLPEASLSTAEQIAAQHREICALLQEYQALVQKDMGEIDAMIRYVQNVDAELAKR